MIEELVNECLGQKGHEIFLEENAEEEETSIGEPATAEAKLDELDLGEGSVSPDDDVLTGLSEEDDFVEILDEDFSYSI